MSWHSSPPGSDGKADVQPQLPDHAPHEQPQQLPGESSSASNLAVQHAEPMLFKQSRMGQEAGQEQASSHISPAQLQADDQAVIQPSGNTLTEPSAYVTSGGLALAVPPTPGGQPDLESQPLLQPYPPEEPGPPDATRWVSGCMAVPDQSTKKALLNRMRHYLLVAAGHHPLITHSLLMSALYDRK
jgi:hypothetical protein